MPFKIPHLWVRRHTAMREYKDPSFGTKPERLYQIFSGLVDRFLHLKLKIHNQPGMIISISGLDGAGKSSHIDSLVNAFTICEIKTMTLWTRAGSLPITKFFTKINHVSAFRNNENEVDKVHIASPVSSFKIYIWKLLNILDFLIYYGIFVRIQKYLNRVVICDRYFIDTVVDMESYNRIGKINRFLYKLYKALIPEPDLVLFIKVDPRNIKKRNKSTPTEDFRFNHTLYEKLIKTNKVLIVDNSDRFDLVSTKLIKTTLSKYFSRYPEKSQNYKTISFKFK